MWSTHWYKFLKTQLNTWSVISLEVVPSYQLTDMVPLSTHLSSADLTGDGAFSSSTSNALGTDLFALDEAFGKVCIALDKLRLRILRSEFLNGVSMRLRDIGDEDFVDVCSGSLSSSSRRRMDLRPTLDEAYMIFEARWGSSFISRRGCCCALSVRLGSAIGCWWLVTRGGV